MADTKSYRISRAELDKWVAGSDERRQAGHRAGRAARSSSVSRAHVGRGALPRRRQDPVVAERAFVPGATEELFSHRVDDGKIHLTEPVGPKSDPRLVRRSALRRVRPRVRGRRARPDAIYARRRARTFIVALACPDSEPECFCTAVGGAPDGTEGSDVFGGAAAEGLARSLAHGGWRDALGEHEQALERGLRRGLGHRQAQGEKVAKKMRGQPIARDWAQKLEERFESGTWGQLAKSCVGCSICTYVCPSCTCST